MKAEDQIRKKVQELREIAYRHKAAGRKDSFRMNLYHAFGLEDALAIILKEKE
jgi:hypothetical protein